MSQLVIPSVTYLSQGDEDAFFAWLGSIPGVIEIVGSGLELVVTLSDLPLSEPALRELIALHHRYCVLTPSLAQFETPENSRWFADRNSYWHAAVFGT